MVQIGSFYAMVFAELGVRSDLNIMYIRYVDTLLYYFRRLLVGRIPSVCTTRNFFIFDIELQADQSVECVDKISAHEWLCATLSLKINKVKPVIS